MTTSEQQHRTKRIALVTGCSSGIGKELARALNAQSDIRVYATARRLQSIRDLENEGMVILELDVTDAKSIKNCISTIKSNEGRIDILVNNAGITHYSPAIELPDKDARDIIDTNFFGLINVTNEAAKIMVDQRSGLVVQIGSVSGLVSNPFSSMYCASKAAVHAWSDALRMELAPFGVKVVIVQPGAVKSELANNAIPEMNQRLESTGTLYERIREYIVKRSTYAVDRGMPAKDFAERTINAVLRANPPAHYVTAPLSMQMRILYHLPASITDYILSYVAGLHKLAEMVRRESNEQK
ncbi:hypothetical protein SAMD00019534_036510 [Acytostelium subglobosum LB1]|uniref:hypothetical protein n=1 Tax=Acytostelium subglobosum LB1 TaxID=1410327 RepID=UPI0006451943|nr:hypothetical protein SAMD00019534_036510 [Acytostelium subglobosum LB1]GAM20476.1 hypothetical protein SAMD00019534_036510 [Acytostelium subglobosum LB1]|eukprot:XP_012759997.1 hypothetical protein SAMD00019534_036510 [Acytostelium subglobosum LB1]